MSNDKDFEFMINQVEKENSSFQTASISIKSCYEIAEKNVPVRIVFLNILATRECTPLNLKAYHTVYQQINQASE